jgi:ABC-type transport system substrate-binding protein
MLNGTAQGVLLGVIAFVLVSSAMPLTATAASSSGPLFSMTLIAPTSNPTRRQWASIITQSLDSINIGANLVFINFDELLADFFNCPAGCPPPTYANGGFDAGFVGFGGGSPLPDFGTQNVIVYRDIGAGDVPPIGSNYYFFDNSTYNQLALQYDQTFTQADRIPILQHMLAIVEQQEPTMILFYPTSVYAWASDLQSWGGSSIDATTANSDYSHWKCTDACTTLNIAETGDIGGINVFPTAAQNSYYSAYLYYPVQACGECLDPRTTSYFDGTVQSVTSSGNNTHYSVVEKAHTFTDSAPVTSDDYIYSVMAGLINQVGWVSTGTFTGILGNSDQFTYSNGTNSYVFNGTFYNHTPPSGFTATSHFTAYNANNTWTFTMNTPYIFTDPVITGVSATPMELYTQYAFSTWSTGVLSGFTGSSGGLSTGTYTYTWNTATYGGNGSYKAYGPVGDGAYIYHGYDPVGLVGTEVRNPNFYNATGLQSMGWDKIQTVHVVYINGKDAAIAAMGSGSVNFLDSNYQPDAADVSSMRSSGLTVVEVNDPSNGWQEMGLNLNNPVFGTGAATPLGQSNPSEAAFAARMVRTAISYAIPRSEIVSQLLQGLGSPGITQVAPSFTYAYPTGGYDGISSAPNPYDLTMAKSFLAAAGYPTGVAPPQPGSGASAVTIGNVKVPGLLLGSSITLSGAFRVDPTLGIKSGGFAITLQQSTNGGANWTSVALGSTTTAGTFNLNYQPTVEGNVTYRIFFTGLAETFVQAGAFTTPSEIEAQVPPIAAVAANVTDTQFSAPVTYNIGSLADLISAVTGAVNTGLANLQSGTTSSISGVSSQVSTLNTNVNSLTSQINTLNSNLSTTTDIAYVAIAVAIILGIAAIALSRRKPA